jgi:anti-sigma-K factor RskA
VREKHFNHLRRVQDVAEDYSMGTLPPSEERAFEDHYLTCDRCAAMVERTDVYVCAMVAAARKLREDGKRTEGAGSATV